jgi:xanthine dehydrogenase accessory factor
MKELQEILAKVKTLAPDESAVLATVVDVVGSSYRLPGARMLILANGETYGTVSGGCLEADVMERAKQVLKTGEPQVITYDTRTNEDSVFSLNMGCNGVIRVLLERINKDSPLLRYVNVRWSYRERSMIATLISGDKTSSLQIGGRIFFDKIEQFYFEGLPDKFEFKDGLLRDCERFYYQNSNSHLKKYETEKGGCELLFENIELPLSLLIFGAGADAVPLCEIAKSLGWRVSVIDHRPAFAASQRFGKADDIIVSRPENYNIPFDENAVAVVMTHNYERDKVILSRLLKSEVRYVGALGPKRRTESILNELIGAGENFTNEQLDRLYAPVGLDIGAKTPEGIALSIIAEIQAVLAKREGGFLRNRVGSIYNRAE